MEKALEVFELFEQREKNTKYFASKITARKLADEKGCAVERIKLADSGIIIYKVAYVE